ncbi:hypothetical protein PoB_000868800 [Plakobranchus ocellatus]|uniref:Uncharacterized protein n=1 Tax=Plakobranchus ocellatus TaxID=259542 RepID=A0AAV3YII3_9GAST|nr:hypothetical protein PoB_000868800 [Plakobranchus ocellatus]
MIISTGPRCHETPLCDSTDRFCFKRIWRSSLKPAFSVMAKVLSDKATVVLLLFFCIMGVTFYLNLSRFSQHCAQPNSDAIDGQTPNAIDRSAVDEKKVAYLSQLLKDRLEAVTEGGPGIPKLVCEETNSTAPCKSRVPCDRPLESRMPEDRIRELLSTPTLQLSSDQLNRILSLSEDIPENDLIIASAISSNHFDEMQAMFKNLHEVVFPRLKNFGMVLFDLGLSEKQRNITLKNCRCQIVPFKFELFPPHMSDLRCFSWKPLIFRSVIAKARKLIVYQDSSIRWNENFAEAFERALKYGQQTICPKYSDNVPSNSLKQTLDYLNEDVCNMRMFHELQAGIQMNRHDPLVIEALLDPWCRCALEDSCMCPIKPSAVISCRGNHLHRCHRFDQSAFNTIMAKIYGVERYKMAVPEKKMPLKILRGDKNSVYFKE